MAPLLLYPGRSADWLVYWGMRNAWHSSGWVLPAATRRLSWLA